MLVNPENMVFETPIDVVDYVSKGMVPTRKNFEKVMLKVRCPDGDENERLRGEVYIPERFFIDYDKDTLTEVLDRVYKNRVRNRNITIGILGVVAAGLLVGGIHNSKKDNDIDDSHSFANNIDVNEIEVNELPM